MIVTRAGGYDDDDDDDDDNRASDEYDLTIGPRLDKTVFVTSTLHTGNLGGLQGADLICNQRAHEAGLSGTYKAWLADSTGAPSSRFIQSVVPYVRTDGALVAVNYTDLTDGSLANPINRTESGTLAAPDVNTWTNVTVSGVAESTDDLQHCFDWTSSSSASMEGGQVGRLDRTDALWTDFPGGGVSCQNFALRLYCFEQ